MSSSNGDDGGQVVEYEYQEEYVRNSRGMRLFSCRWLPKSASPKALVFLCHGYAVECSVTMRGTGERLAAAGYGVYGLDYEGHGRSEGLQGYVPEFDSLVADCDAFFVSKATGSSRRFLLGESMGGAVALLLHRARPDFWTGAVLVAPMCKIADDMRPHPVVVNILKAMTNIIPTWKIVPTNDVIDFAYKTQEKRDEIRTNPYCYKGKPRLKTAYELLKVSLHLEANLLHQVTLPFLIVHGGADKVTDPSVSELLHRSAASQDKTLKLYPGMWHALTSGESPDNIQAVFQDIIAWLDHRSTEEEPSPSEAEQKARHDDLHLLHANKTAARSGTKARASSGPPPPFLQTEEAEEEEEEEEEREWSGSEEEEEEQEWAGGNGAARGEDSGADAGEDLSGWKRKWPRPRELFVCNLPRRCGAEDLLELFRPHGTVLSVEIKRNGETGISRGCAFVTMRSLAEARAAVEALDGFDMDGREVFVKVASHVISNRKNVKLPHITPMKDHIFESPHKIYVGNLAWSVQPHDLRELFAQCGTVVSTRLLSDRKGGRNRVYGFLSFSSAEELQAALKLDRTVFHGRDILVKEAHLERQTHGAVKDYS
ncbi:hypothetical protein EJB05_53833 [Eragrostis curvula]|uniref:RRM domain-containing protein n=1 Tax=Eragrostis curvula TaxID=38414 RepID=A0A5J9SP11_9POAL|nr:hypothetical protein EJB05_53833 [Eragrostis curvula]